MSNLHAKRVAQDNENASSDQATIAILTFWLFMMPALILTCSHGCGKSACAANQSPNNVSNATNASLQSMAVQLNATNASLQNATTFDKNLTIIANATPDYPKPFVSNPSMQNYHQPR